MAEDSIQRHGNGFKDIAGQRFGRLLVLEYLRTVKKRTHWLCHCDCGTDKVVTGGALRRGITLSCGCLRREQLTARSTSHGATVGSMRGGARRPEYTCWGHVVQRCTNEKNRSWPHYGGRGIRICDEWRNSFEAFLEYVGPKPSPSHSIDRINVDGHYEPGNVRWATASEQSSNRRAFVHRKKKACCPLGHPYDEANTYWLKNGARRCRICKRQHGMETDLRRKERRDRERSI